MLYKNYLLIKFILKLTCDAINTRQKARSLVINLNTAATMSVLHKCFVSLRSSFVSRLTMSTRGGLNQPPAAGAWTRLLPLQVVDCFPNLIPAGRRETCSYKSFSTSANIQNDTVGQIQSTHYHLVYTCKVRKTISWHSFWYTINILEVIVCGLFF